MRLKPRIFAKLFLLLVVLMLFLTSVTIVLAVAEPEGPSDLNLVNSSRRTASQRGTYAAEAGNITEITLVGTTVTQSWAGFVGNITGTITLDNYKNNTLYNWTLADPEGEVYATYLPNVNWTTGTVLCWNWSSTTSAYLQLGELEGWYNSTPLASIPAYGNGYTNLSVATDDVDGVNETFTCPVCRSTTQITEPNDVAVYNHSAFFVGGQEISGLSATHMNGTCPYVKTYNSTFVHDYEEVILYHDAAGVNNDGIIYTAILQQGDRAHGFDNGLWDFQMLVGENGHNGDTSVTTYYFYIEIE